MVAGNPVRDSIRRGRRCEGQGRCSACPMGLPLLFFLGGSQGARQINELVAAALPRLTEAAFVVHQTGGPERTRRGAADGPRYKSFAYIREEMPDLLAAADLVVGRAGAGTLWESAALGKPMVLVPLCGAGTRGDQVDNAALFARAGAAVSLVGAEATPDAPRRGDAEPPCRPRAARGRGRGREGPGRPRRGLATSPISSSRG